MSFRDIDDVYRYLDTIPTFQKEGAGAADFNLDKFRRFCDDIGAPHKAGHFIHVAGTNGKGSTCRLLASVYQEAGYTVGLYTSPHLEHFSERFVINGARISDQDLLRFFREHEHPVKAYELSYFELSTAIAFWWFKDRKADISIIETGLGGRLDATNIIRPAASVITSVSFDHTDILGETLGEIATEKAGIIKEHVPVVIGSLEKEAERAVVVAAQNKHAQLLRATELDPEFRSGACILRDGRDTITFEAGLRAPVQVYNIAMAWQVAKTLGDAFPVAPAMVQQGINTAAHRYPNRGRFEKLTARYDWYFDGAHNLEAVKAMKRMVAAIQAVDEAVLVLSIMEDKLNPDLAKEFSEFKKIFYHAVESNRAAPVDTVRQYLPDLSIMPVKKELQQKLFEEFESELVIFAGSFYFYSTVDRWIEAFATSR